MKPRARCRSLNSVRVRLTLWNVGVLALGLAAAGIIFILSMRSNISAAVDRNLSQRAHHMQRVFADAPPSLIERILSGKDPHPASDARSLGQTRVGQLPNSTTVPHSVAPASPPREEGRFGELRPRLFNARGQPIPAGEKPFDPANLARSLRGEEVYSTIREGADPVRVFSIPLQRRGRVVAVAQFGNSLAHLREEQARMTRTLVTLIPVVLLIAGAGGAFLTARALRPVRRIARTAGRIEAENLSQRLPIIGNDEFADLAETFNAMLSRLQRAFEQQEQAFEQQRRFTADASHELRTPLSIIKASTSLALQNRRTVAELQKTLQTVDAAADRMNKIVQDQLILARSDAGQPAYHLVPVPLAEILTQAASVIRSPERAPILLALQSPSLEVNGDADALARLFGNLLENAARHTSPEGCITISTESLGDIIVVEVADTGEGVAPEHLPHLTERFYRVDAGRSRAHGGTGLGLAICRSIAEAHGGDLTIASVLGQGTTVRITLPRAAEASSSAAIDSAEPLVRV